MISKSRCAPGRSGPSTMEPEICTFLPRTICAIHPTLVGTGVPDTAQDWKPRFPRSATKEAKPESVDAMRGPRAPKLIAPSETPVEAPEARKDPFPFLCTVLPPHFGAVKRPSRDHGTIPPAADFSDAPPTPPSSSPLHGRHVHLPPSRR